MEKSLLYRLILVVATVVVFTLALVPTMCYDYSGKALAEATLSTEGGDPRNLLPDWWKKGFLKRLLPQNSLNLGLDLQGGMDVVVSVNVDNAIVGELRNNEEALRDVFKEHQVEFTKLEVDPRAEIIRVDYLNPKSMRDAEQIYGDHFPNTLVVASGKDTLVQQLVLPDTFAADIKRRTVQQVRNVLTRRMDAFGLREPEITLQGENRIRLQLPGARDPVAIRDGIITRAKLDFYLVDTGKDGNPAVGKEKKALEQQNQGQAPPGMVLASWTDTSVRDAKIVECYFDQGTGIAAGPVSINRRLGLQKEEAGSLETGACYLLREDKYMSGAGLADARPSRDPDPLQSRYVVNFVWDTPSARRFADLTGANIEKLLAVVLDGEVASAPVIRSRIYRRGEISGNFTAESATNLSTILRSGSLEVGITFEEERVVGATLGADSIRAGTVAAFWGSLLVIVFMVVYYSTGGFIANLALILNILFLMGTMALFGATLTLPGIAGIVLTVGMSVDANVLIFERMREELRLGKTPVSAVDAGYAKALWTILDSNITTLIAGLVLYQWGTGPIKGFAVTLSVGIITSVFTAVVVSRLVYDLIFYFRKGAVVSIGIPYEPASLSARRGRN